MFSGKIVFIILYMVQFHGFVQAQLRRPRGEYVHICTEDCLLILNQSTDTPPHLTQKKIRSAHHLIFDHFRNWNSLAPWLEELQHFTTVTLANDTLNYIPDEVKALDHTDWLCFSKVFFRNNPDDLCGFQELLSLQFYNSSPVDLSILDDCRDNIQYISLIGAKFSCIPQELYAFRNLKSLDFSLNPIVHIPDSLFRLPLLNNVTFTSCRLKEFPAAALLNPSIENISISKNEITSLPVPDHPLWHLNGLDLSFNPLVALPDSICRYQGLYYLIAQDCGLSGLPESFSALKRLDHLSISMNPLEEFPPQLFSLGYLDHLDLSSCQLTEITGDFSKMESLRCLDLCNNDLKMFPEALGALPKLKILRLFGNHISSIPDNLSGFTHLSFLDVSGNNLSRDDIKRLKRQLRGCEIITD